MITSRGPLLARLNEAAVGLSSKEILEQSNSFVFKGGKLTTFNDEIMCRVDSPLDFDVVVNASDLTSVLSKIPDDEIDISIQGSEIRIKGKKKKAGINCSTEVLLPIGAVPAPGAWSRIGEGTLAALQHAAETCGKDETQYLTTCVHVLPDKIEASDNYRYISIEGRTGFPSEVLIPASSIAKLEGLEITKIAQGEGWIHFKTVSGAEISMRCSHQKYHDGADTVLTMDNPENITLPVNLGEMIERAEVFITAAYDSKVGIQIANERLKITSRKETGWYREEKRIRYQGRPLEFEVNPKFLAEVLKRTRDVKVDSRKMKIEYDRIKFVVALTTKVQVDEDDATVPPAKPVPVPDLTGDDIPF